MALPDPKPAESAPLESQLNVASVHETMSMRAEPQRFTAICERARPGPKAVPVAE